MKIKHYISGCDTRLRALKRKLASDLSRTFVFTGDLKELLVSLGEEGDSEGQVLNGPTEEAEIMAPRAVNPAGPERKPSGTVDSAVDNSNHGKPGADN